MPGPYTLLRRDTRLSARDVETICAAAREAGFAAIEGPGDAAGLTPMLTGLDNGWLHLRGTRVAAELPVPGIVVYDQQALTLSAEAVAVLAGAAPVVLPLFSPRSAALAATAAVGTAPLWIVPISAAAGAAWDRARPGHAPRLAGRLTAARPDAAAIRDAVARLVGPA